MFRHIVMFRFRDDADTDTITALLGRMLELPDAIPALRSYAAGRDAQLSDGNWDLVVVAEFDDAAGYQEYATHPAHLPIIDDIRRLSSARAAVQTSEMA